MLIKRVANYISAGFRGRVNYDNLMPALILMQCVVVLYFYRQNALFSFLGFCIAMFAGGKLLIQKAKPCDVDQGLQQDQSEAAQASKVTRNNP